MTEYIKLGDMDILRMHNMFMKLNNKSHWHKVSNTNDWFDSMKIMKNKKNIAYCILLHYFTKKLTFYESICPNAVADPHDFDNVENFRNYYFLAYCLNPLDFNLYGNIMWNYLAIFNNTSIKTNMMMNDDEYIKYLNDLEKVKNEILNEEQVWNTFYN